MSDIDFLDAMRIIASEIDYQEFIAVGYAFGCILFVYMDHIGVNVHQWLLDEQVNVCTPDDKLSCVGEVMEDLHVEGEFEINLNELQGNMADNVEDVHCIPMNKTLNDDFLNKLWPMVQPIPNNPPHEDPYVHIYGRQWGNTWAGNNF